MALQQRSRVLHSSAAPAVGPALPCSAVCRSCVARSTGCKCFVALRRCLQVLRGTAALGVTLVRPCSAGCWSCMAPQLWVLVLHSPAAPFASPAWPCSARWKRYTALQHQVQILHSRAAPLVSLAGPCSTVCGSCTALQQGLGGLGGPAMPRWPGAAPQCFPGTLSAPRRLSWAGSQPALRHSEPAWCSVGASQAVPAPAPGARSWDARAGAGASAGAGAGGKQVPVVAQLERRQGGARLGSVVPGARRQLRGSRRRWWGPWGRLGKEFSF